MRIYILNQFSFIKSEEGGLRVFMDARTQLVIGSILLAPIRFVLILLLMLLALLFVKIALIGLSVSDIHNKPFTPWRKNLLFVVRYAGDFILLGFDA